MRIEMERFRVRAGKEARAREWIAFLRENPEAFRETLEPEIAAHEVLAAGAPAAEGEASPKVMTARPGTGEP